MVPPTQVWQGSKYWISHSWGSVFVPELWYLRQLAKRWGFRSPSSSVCWLKKSLGPFQYATSTSWEVVPALSRSGTPFSRELTLWTLCKPPFHPSSTHISSSGETQNLLWKPLRSFASFAEFCEHPVLFPEIRSLYYSDEYLSPETSQAHLKFDVKNLSLQNLVTLRDLLKHTGIPSRKCKYFPDTLWVPSKNAVDILCTDRGKPRNPYSSSPSPPKKGKTASLEREKNQHFLTPLGGLRGNPAVRGVGDTYVCLEVACYTLFQAPNCGDVRLAVSSHSCGQRPLSGVWLRHCKFRFYLLLWEKVTDKCVQWVVMSLFFLPKPCPVKATASTRCFSFIWEFGRFKSEESKKLFVFSSYILF